MEVQTSQENVKTSKLYLLSRKLQTSAHLSFETKVFHSLLWAGEFLVTSKVMQLLKRAWYFTGCIVLTHTACMCLSSFSDSVNAVWKSEEFFMLFHISAQIELVQLSLLIQVMDTTITKHKTGVMNQQKGIKIAGLLCIFNMDILSYFIFNI